jgi:hypothetical protein
MLCIGDPPRLEAPPVLASLLQRLRSNPDADFWDLCRIEALSLGEGAFQRGLEYLARALDSQRLELAFDYLHFNSNCRSLLQVTQQAFETRDLHITIPGLLSSDTTFARLHPAYRSESDIWKMAAILRRFIAESGRDVRTKATKIVAQSHSSNFLRPVNQIVRLDMDRSKQPTMCI